MSFWWGRDSLMDSLYRWIAVFLLASLLAPSLAAQEDRASLLEREKALEAKFKELASEHSLSDSKISPLPVLGKRFVSLNTGWPLVRHSEARPDLALLPHSICARVLIR